MNARAKYKILMHQKRAQFRRFLRERLHAPSKARQKQAPNHTPKPAKPVTDATSQSKGH